MTTTSTRTTDQWVEVADQDELRSQLWDPDSWAPNDTVPRRAVIAHQLQRPDETVEELDEYYGPSYAERLYR